MPDTNPACRTAFRCNSEIVRHPIGTLSGITPECCPPSARNRVRHGAERAPTFLIDSPVVRSPSLTDCCEYHMVINENRRSNERTANIRNQAIYTTPDRRRRIAAPGCLRQHQSQQCNSKYGAERASDLEHDHVGQLGLDLRNETNFAQFTPGRGRCRGTYNGLDERIVWRTARYGNDSKHVYCRFSSKSCGREREFHG